MRLHRFFIQQTIGGQKHLVVADGGLIHQLLKVFRYKVGQGVVLFDSSGSDYQATIQAIEKHDIVFHIEEKTAGLVPGSSLGLCFSLVKKNNNEFILEKCTELGVTDFYPVVSERSEKKGFNMDRAKKIVQEAVEQSGWSVIPTIHEPSTLEEVFKKTKEKQHIVFHTEKVSKNKDEIKNAILFVGPEGGWSPTEVEFFKEKDAPFDFLGQSILRAETAAIVAVAKYIEMKIVD